MQTQSKHVQTVLVTDPDTGGLCEVEIRKLLEGGTLVGLDGAFLEQTDDNAFSPYDKGVEIIIPDDEAPLTDADYSLYPHYVLINYGDEVTAGLYNFPNKGLALEMVFGIIVNRLDGIYAEDDDGMEFSVKIAKALNKGVEGIDEALALYHSVPDNLEVIEYGRIALITEIPEQYRATKDDLADHLEA